MELTQHTMQRYAVYALMLAVLPAFFACKSFEGATVNVKPNPLEVHADSVKATVRASIPPKSGIRKKGIYRGQIAIKGDGNTYQMASVAVRYEDVPDIKKLGVTKSIDIQQPYQEGMNGGKLVAENYYERKGKTFELDPIDLAPCCITTSLLICEDYKMISVPAEYEAQVPITLEAKFQFPQDVSKIQPTEYEKGSINDIGEFLEKKYAATKVRLEGFASPEGPYARNKRLAIERMRNVQEWLIAELDTNGYEIQKDSTFFELATTTEDWEGFKANLDKTNYPEDVKRQIIEIISSGLEPEVMERKVLNLVGGVNEVEFILAPLRRTTIRLEGESSSHSDEQIKQFVADFVAKKKSKKDMEEFFEKEEMLYASELVESTDHKVAVLEEYTRLNPSDFRGLNNLGVIMYEESETDEALEMLRRAEDRADNNPTVQNNIGVVYLMRKDYAEGAANLEEAYASLTSKEAAFNLGVLKEKRAKYEDAASLFEKANDITCASYNAGLSNLLSGDLAGAKSDIENAIRNNKDRAMNYYLMSIVGARSADKNLLLLNLKRAVQIDRELSEKAIADLEFRRYWDDAEFNAAVNP